MRSLAGCVAMLLLLAECAVALAADMTAAAAVNLAGRQRMLSQRIVKAYAQVGLGVAPELSAAQLASAIETYDQQIVALKAFAPNDAIRATLARMADTWKPFREIAQGPVTPAGARRLLAEDAKLLEVAEQLTQQFEAYAGIPAAQLVNQSGRQRMLSERLAKLYMLRAWGIESPEMARETRLAGTEFEVALSRLQAAKQNTYAINRELEALTVQWTWFKSALEQEGDYQSFQVVVADSSEAMLYSMDNITRLYEELSREDVSKR